MKSTKTIAKDLLVHASDKSPTPRIGRVSDVKKQALKLSRRERPDGKRRSIPGEWVKLVKGNMVWLSWTATTAGNEGGRGDDPDSRADLTSSMSSTAGTSSIGYR
ncbi:DUF2171 domain-containing protein [Deinococcus alpinitundrae]|uniref:DUF2171 domain-containing protein n=1 Tax=Deinococcus alpinitundrae TaxID=468913 RepID=UPI00137B7E64